MSPLLLLVFIPVFLGGISFAALLVGAATAGAWETAEDRSQEQTAEEELARLHVESREKAA